MPSYIKSSVNPIQVVAEEIGLENYLIRNVAALRSFQWNVCLREIKTLCRHALFEFLSGRTNWNFEDLQEGNNFLLISSWRFYNRQEEVLDQNSPKVIDRFVFNYLAVDNAGQTADNKHTGRMIFRFFLQASKTDKPLEECFSEPVSKPHLLTCLFLHTVL